GYPLNSYSSIGEYNEEVKAYNTKFEEKFQNLSTEDKVAMGKKIFLVQCSACHGITGDGINGKAQNLNI
ncbi:cytochrome c, partial [Campylobacter jejuni]|uniref:cytochrome c n=1 Tax=Campylobacter jejuni TaxID=197 RepID=UPI001BFCF075